MPTQQDVQRLIALREARKRGMMGPTQTAALQEIERRMSMSDQVASYVEPAMTAASAAFAEPVSGLVGLAALPFGADVSSRAIERTQDALTYQPRTEGGQQNLQGLMSFMAPVGEAFEGASSYLGDAAYEATGSPALGAAAYSIPAAGLELLGLRGTRQLSKSGKLGRQLEMGDIGPSGPGARQRGAVGGVRSKPDVPDEELTLYHGTAADDFDRFDPSKESSFASADTAGVVTLTPYQNIAKSYALGGDDLVQDLKSPTGYARRFYDPELGLSGMMDQVPAQPRVLETKFKGKVKRVDMSGQSHDAAKMKAEQVNAMREGYDAIEFTGLTDDTFYNPLGGTSDTVQVFNPDALEIVRKEPVSRSTR